jgi:hypothetical protein
LRVALIARMFDGMSYEQKAIGRAPKSVSVEVPGMKGLFVGERSVVVDDAELLDELASSVETEREMPAAEVVRRSLPGLVAQGMELSEARRKLEAVANVNRMLIDATALELLRRGVRQSVLCEVLGISRQAVSKKYGHLVREEVESPV